VSSQCASSTTQRTGRRSASSDQERQTRCENEKALLCRALLETEGDAKRSGLGRGQLVELAERRPKQLVEIGERQLRLRLDGMPDQDVHIGRALAGVFQQRRLADSGLPAHDERAASRPTRSSQ
jgi:hypothetical protein